ncbi:hypothetical protein TWF281_006120 [Arthrobotrys megalospora]
MTGPSGELLSHKVFKKSYTDIYDTNPAWMNTQCLNFPTNNPERGLTTVEYYSGPPINPYHPYFLSRLIIFNALNCPDPGPNLRWHYLPLETLDESELPYLNRPKWLRDPNAKYRFDATANNDEATIDFPEYWEDMPNPVVPKELGKEPYWIDYSNSEAYSTEVEKRRTGVSKFKGDEYINELANTFQGGMNEELQFNPEYYHDPEGYDKNNNDYLSQSTDYSSSDPGDFKEHMKNPLWNVYDVSKDEPPFWGNVSVIFVPDYMFTHVLGLAREFDGYARGGEEVGGWEVPDWVENKGEEEDEGLTRMGSSPGRAGEEM